MAKRQKDLLPTLELKSIWVSRLYNVFQTAYIFENMPFPKEIWQDVKKYMFDCLLTHGNFALANGKMGEIIGGNLVRVGGVTWYNSAMEYQIVNPISTITKNRDDIAMCFLTPSRRPIADIINYYANYLTEIDLCIQMNVRGQKTPPILKAPMGQEKSYEAAYENIAGFKPVVLGYSNLLETTGGHLEYQPPAAYVADKLEMLKHDVLNDFYQMFGLTSKPTEKKTVLISDEINADKEALEINNNTFLDGFTLFVRQLNELFGCSAIVKLNVTAPEWDSDPDPDPDPDPDKDGDADV